MPVAGLLAVSVWRHQPNCIELRRTKQIDARSSVGCQKLIFKSWWVMIQSLTGWWLPNNLQLVVTDDHTRLQNGLWLLWLDSRCWSSTSNWLPTNFPRRLSTVRSHLPRWRNRVRILKFENNQLLASTGSHQTRSLKGKAALFSNNWIFAREGSLDTFQF